MELKIEYCASSYAFYEDRIYILTSSSYTRKVCVLTLNGRFIESWSFFDSHNSGGNQLIIVSNRIVIADRLTKTVVIYSLSGEVINKLPCPLVSDYLLALCSAGEDAIIIADVCLHKIFRFSLTTGEVMWRHDGIRFPESLVLYGNKYVLCVSIDMGRGSDTGTVIYVLDISTGELMSTLPKLPDEYDRHVSCCIAKDKLVLSKRNSELFYYQLH